MPALAASQSAKATTSAPSRSAPNLLARRPSHRVDDLGDGCDDLSQCSDENDDVGVGHKASLSFRESLRRMRKRQPAAYSGMGTGRPWAPPRGAELHVRKRAALDMPCGRLNRPSPQAIVGKTES